jgi:hypothetical protein
MADFTYDLAFSFVTPDQDAATRLHRRLSPPLNGFLYTEQQESLAGPDGYEKFASVFGEQARMVVLVYRDGWGERGFTLIESNAIKRRMYREGADFLFIVIAETEPRPTLPNWLAVDHVYWDLPTFGLDDAADTIRQRLRRIGCAPKIETAAEMALRQKRERIATSERELFRQTRGTGSRARRVARGLRSTHCDCCRIGWNFARTGVEQRQHRDLIHTGGRAPQTHVCSADSGGAHIA